MGFCKSLVIIISQIPALSPDLDLFLLEEIGS
jgi:hypothetical protein